MACSSLLFRDRRPLVISARRRNARFVSSASSSSDVIYCIISYRSSRGSFFFVVNSSISNLYFPAHPLLPYTCPVIVNPVRIKSKYLFKKSGINGKFFSCLSIRLQFFPNPHQKSFFLIDFVTGNPKSDRRIFQNCGIELPIIPNLVLKQAAAGLRQQLFMDPAQIRQALRPPAS